MIDSMLTLTWRGAFWLAVFFVISAALHYGISAMLGFPEPMFALMALATFAILVVSAGYTLAKKLIGMVLGTSSGTPQDHE